MEITQQRGDPASANPWTARDLAAGVGLALAGYVVVIGLVVLAALMGDPDTDLAVSLVLAVITLAYSIWLAAVVLILATRKDLTLAQIGFRALPSSRYWWPIVAWLGAFGIAIVYGVAVLLVEQVTGADFSRLTEGNVSYPEATDSWVWITLGLSLVVAAPIGEELFFRGLVFRAMQARWGLVAALVLSGGAFALVHFEVSVVLPFWAIGAWFAWAYHRSGSLWTTVIAHAIFNGLSFALTGPWA